MLAIAGRRAVWRRVSPWLVARTRKAVLYWRMTFVVQNLAMSVCSRVRGCPWPVARA
jgi:hypothetical protein